MHFWESSGYLYSLSIRPFVVFLASPQTDGHYCELQLEWIPMTLGRLCWVFRCDSENSECLAARWNTGHQVESKFYIKNAIFRTYLYYKSILCSSKNSNLIGCPVFLFAIPVGLTWTEIMCVLWEKHFSLPVLVALCLLSPKLCCLCLRYLRTTHENSF